MSTRRTVNGLLLGVSEMIMNIQVIILNIQWRLIVRNEVYGRLSTFISKLLI